MMNLTKKDCLPCEAGAPPLTGSTLGEYFAELHEGWELCESDTKIRREFNFKDFRTAIAFVNSVADLAESKNHHPDIHILNYKNVVLELWTHKIAGLTENDFILAAKIDALQLEAPQHIKH